MDLLPRAVDDFRSQEYWESFFRKRGAATFEWYGEYAHVSHLLRRWIGANDRILVVGCGNSELGSAMYDAGYRNIVSIDFSEVVIDEMRAKNAHRKGMQFQLMDMLHMSFEAASFDVVLDKACLDALMSEDTEPVREQARQMAREVERVLKPRGRLVCISLLQGHIARHLASTYFAHPPRWRVHGRAFAAGDESDLCPFFLACCKLDAEDAAAALARDESVLVTGEDEHTGPVASAGEEASREAFRAWALDEQRGFRMARDLRDVVSGRVLNAELWTAGSDLPRYRLAVADARTVHAPARARVAVLLVPLGREHEFSFAQEEGQLALARGTEYDRLILAAPVRGHAYASVKAVQEELNGRVTRFCPRRCVEPVPYLSVAAEVDQRTEVARVDSALGGGGGLVVEDVVPPTALLESVLSSEQRRAAEARAASTPGSPPPFVLRRLVFLANRNAVQSEQLMVYDPAAAAAGVAGAAGGRGKKKRRNKKGKAAAAAAAAAAPPPEAVDGNTVPTKGTEEAAAAPPSTEAQPGPGAQDGAGEAGSGGGKRRRRRRKGGATLSGGAPASTGGASDRAPVSVADLGLSTLDFGLTALEAGADVAPPGEGAELPAVPLGIAQTEAVAGPQRLARAPYAAVPYLAFEVHATMAAALALAEGRWLPRSRAEEAAAALLGEAGAAQGGAGAAGPAAAPPSLLVLGLGGGSLPHFLSRALPSAVVHVAELDPAVVEVADRCFGVRAGRSLRIGAVDGMDAVRAAAGVDDAGAARAAAAGFPRRRHHAVLVDVDSKELRDGLSFPPAAFLAPTFLATLRAAVREEDGVVVINLACRAAAVRAQVLAAVKDAFRGGDAFLATVPDSANVVVVASPRPRPDVVAADAAPAGAGGKGKGGGVKGKGRKGGKAAKGTALGEMAQRLPERLAVPWHAVLDASELLAEVRRL